MTGFTVAREEGRTREVLDVLSWDLGRIKALLTQSPTDVGRDSLLFELLELESEIQAIQRVQHVIDGIHNAFEAMTQEVVALRRTLEEARRGHLSVSQSEESHKR